MGGARKTLNVLTVVEVKALFACFGFNYMQITLKNESRAERAKNKEEKFQRFWHTKSHMSASAKAGNWGIRLYYVVGEGGRFLLTNIVMSDNVFLLLTRMLQMIIVTEIYSLIQPITTFIKGVFV